MSEMLTDGRVQKRRPFRNIEVDVGLLVPSFEQVGFSQLVVDAIVDLVLGSFDLVECKSGGAVAIHACGHDGNGSFVGYHRFLQVRKNRV